MSAAQTVNSQSNVNQVIQGMGSTTKAEKAEDPLGYNSFITMMVAQLEHQDPLNPTEGTDFTAQLAQFSSLEQQISMNQNLENILDSLNSDNHENLLDYIGKEVLSSSNNINVLDGAVSKGAYTLQDTAEVMVTVHDQYGVEVRRLFLGQLEAGTHDLNWDGYDNNGVMVPDGDYSYQIAAVNQGAPIPVELGVLGVVTGITNEQGNPYLVVGDRLVDPASIVKVQMIDDAEDSSLLGSLFN